MNRSQLIKRIDDFEKNMTSELRLIKSELSVPEEPADNIVDEKPIVLIIGHTAESGGATNKEFNVSEYMFNKALVEEIVTFLNESNFKRKIIVQERTGYIKLPKQINDHKPLFAISLHANAFNEKATGTEMLYYYGSESSKQLATILQENICKALGLKDRGIKAKNEKDRGGYLLKKVDCPIVITEPFFIDNVNDFIIMEERKRQLITAYINSIIVFNIVMEKKNGR
jgi:N-acetylmuramoyl-L-alanine amidase